MFWKINASVILATGLAVGMSGCGGGGSSASAPVVSTPARSIPVPVLVDRQQSAEGIWGGAYSAAANARVAVLEDGSAWGFLVSTGSPNVVAGGIFARFAVAGSVLGGSGFEIGQGGSAAASYAGAVGTKAGLDFSNPAAGGSFVGGYNVLYDQAPAPVSSLAGTYVGYAAYAGSAAGVVSVSLDASGALSSFDVPGCVEAGAVSARASGKNVYDVSASFAGAGCKLGDAAAVKGVAIWDAGNSQLYYMAKNASGTNGVVFIGIKQ
jgi:hypothetical protein